MKRILTLLLCLLSLTAFAQEPLWIDYCDGKKATAGSQEKTSEEISLAIRIPQDVASGFAGSEVKYVAIGWPSGHPGSEVTGWVRSSQTGNNLTATTIKTASGWQEIELENPYLIDGKTDLWVGVTFKPSSKRNSYIGLAGNTDPDGCYCKIGDLPWSSYVELDKGSLPIRAGVVGEHYPHHDLAITALTTDRPEFALGDMVPVKVTVKNLGQDEAKDPLVQFWTDGESAGVFRLRGSIPFGKSLTATYEVDAPNKKLGKSEIKAEVIWGDYELDRTPSNNVRFVEVNRVDALFDLVLSTANIYSSTYKIGDPISVIGTIKSLDGPTCVNPVLHYSFNNGEVEGDVKIPCELVPGKSYNFNVHVPTSGITQDGNYTLDLSIAPNGSSEDYDLDNNSVASRKLTIQAHPFIKRTLVEELTGTWCQFCPQGIYSMGEMNKQYPERFVGIAGHNGDEWAMSAYNNYFSAQGVTGLPSCLVDRDGTVRSPTLAVLTTQVNNDKNLRADAEVEVTGRFNENDEIEMTAEVLFENASTNHNLRLIFIVTEDAVPVSQTNAYAGGSYGTMGGFEKLPSPAKIAIDDVAQLVWPTPTGGDECAYKGDIEAMKPYTFSYTAKLSQLRNLVNKDNLHVNAILIDAALSRRNYINSGKGKVKGFGETDDPEVIVLPEGINTVLAPAATTPAYNLSGRVAGAYDQGITIANGKKVIR